MAGTLNRRAFLARAAAATGWGVGISLFSACAPAAPASPTAAPAKTESKPSPAESKPSVPGSPSSSPSPAASPAAAAQAPAVQGPTQKVTYGIVSYNPFHLVIIVSLEKPEFMAKHGIEVDLILTGSSPAAVQAIMGGSMNMTTGTPEAAWPAQDKEPSLTQVIGVSNGTPYALMVNPDIKKVTDLKGKPVGSTAVRGGADTTALRVLLAENGLKDGDFNVVPIGSIAERSAGMKAGTIMGVAQLEPQTSALRDAGFSELDYADNYPALKGVQTVTGLAKKDWYIPNMSTATAFMRGWIDITKWIYDGRNKEETIAIIAKSMKVDPKHATSAYDTHVTKSRTRPLEPRVDARMMQQMAENQKKTGMENVPTEMAKYIDNSFVDRALA